jgi:hypothetical protein
VLVRILVGIQLVSLNQPQIIWQRGWNLLRKWREKRREGYGKIAESPYDQVIGTLLKPTSNIEDSAMTKRIPANHKFCNVGKRKVDLKFAGGDISSDGGVLWIKEADRLTGLMREVSKVFPDNREQAKVVHSMESMLKQRVYGLALGYEDLNDHDSLRKCPAFQASVGQTTEMASASTLCRLENRAPREVAVNIHKVIVENFIASYKSAPEQLILDFDPTDDLVHGNQEKKFFHGYYRNNCFLPLYVFCGHKLLCSYLRPSDQDQAKHSWAILSLLVKRFRQVWPNVEIVFRGDSGFCRQKMMNWCDKHSVKYIVGLPQNSRLVKLLAPTINDAQAAFEETRVKQRIFTEFQYAAGTWTHTRRVIGKAEVTEKGQNPRFVVTNLEELDSELVYTKIYCARGEMENRIKEQQLMLFADRTSCHQWWANQLRLLLSSLAYILIEHIRSHFLAGTELAEAQVSTIRLKLFKIGAIIIRNTRRILFLLSSSYPYQDLWNVIFAKLAPKPGSG